MSNPRQNLIHNDILKPNFISAAKAGPTGFGYDDYDTEFAYTDQEPPRYDIATQVDGDSMNPDYVDGNILYLRDYGASIYNGEECVVAIDEKSYFKKLYTTDTGLLLVSTNPDKDLYPNFEINFPPTDGTHIKIFNVLGSFTPVETKTHG
ncbi:S24 family peptidase [Streptococcus merionis]|uniref:S24 family peptidase n=1 Tax=Streptococcus merionis TaxID=400065 RepID=UPI003514EAA9